VCLDSSVHTATRYGLDGPGIESQRGARFFTPIQTGPGAHPASCIMGTGSFPGVKRLGSGFDHPPPSSAKVEGRVELYLYSLSGPLWPVIVWNLAFTFTHNWIPSLKSSTISPRPWHHLRKVLNYCNTQSLLYQYTANLSMDVINVKFKIGHLTVKKGGGER